MSTKIDYEAIDSVIKRNFDQFKKPGALLVRPGYKITNGWIVDKPAIVVTVDKKLETLPPDQQLPKSVEGVPVDVREATGLQRLKSKSPTTFDLAKVHMRGEFREPDFQFERAIPDGNILPLNSSTAAPLGLQSPSQKNKLGYSPPAGVQLSKFQGNTTIIACASPDDGYLVLKDFLSKTTSDLTIAMYDFTSADLLQDVVDVVKSGKTFKMVLDNPPKPNPSRNQTDQVTHDTILAAGPNAKINWALVRSDPRVSNWIFPSAYHIKVVVRDANVFWLSSGNFNNSNEPSLDPADPNRRDPSISDRDWHVIILNEGLAKMYKAFIDNDFAAAQASQGVGDEIQHHLISTALDALHAESAKSASVQKPTPKVLPSNFQHQVFNNIPVSIQPLLTPDVGTNSTMYIDNVIDLINSAKSKLYIQTQYIHPSEKPEDVNFMKLLTAVHTAKINGIDVRIILSEFENVSLWVEKIQALDLVSNILKIQNNVHNKGIVVDSKVVMVSSENWSADAALRNRDAGVIIENAGVAQYFEKIFLDDWDKRATVHIKGQ